MNKKIVDGKVHISEKKKPKGKNLFRAMNILDLPEDLKAELAEKGLEPRFINSNQFQANGNMHPNGWQIYKRSDATLSAEAKAFGLPADGTVRRKELVLAVRPKEVGDDHREWLKEKRLRQKMAYKNDAAELKKMAKAQGLETVDETEID